MANQYKITWGLVERYFVFLKEVNDILPIENLTSKYITDDKRLNTVSRKLNELSPDQLEGNSLDIYRDQFFPSKIYNVDRGRLGSPYRANLRPKTLEDIFTFIHQSMNSIISNYYRKRNENLSISKDCSDDIEKIHKIFKKINSNKLASNTAGEVSNTGLNIDSNGSYHRFSLPLRAHAVELDFTCFKNSNLRQISFKAIQGVKNRKKKNIKFSTLMG